MPARRGQRPQSPGFFRPGVNVPESAVGEAGLDDLTFHDLRRTFATRLRAAGVHEYDIADLLGHSTTPGDTRASSVTRGYARAVPRGSGTPWNCSKSVSGWRHAHQLPTKSLPGPEERKRRARARPGKLFWEEDGGEGGIRTHGGLPTTPVFETVSIPSLTSHQQVPASI
jgi:Phage integrase family